MVKKSPFRRKKLGKELLPKNSSNSEQKNTVGKNHLKSDWLNNFWLPVLVGIVIFILSLDSIQNHFNSVFGHIKIEKIDIRNTPEFVGREGVQNEEYYDNLVENIVYFSGTKSLIVDKIVLKNIKVLPYEYEEFKGVSNFDIQTQTFKSHIYQNGNAKEATKVFKVDLIKMSGNVQNLIDSFELGDFEFEQGDVRTVADFAISADILKHFGKHDTEHLLIKIYHEDINNVIVFYPLYYNSKEGRFQPSGQGGGGQPYEILNMFEIISPYQSELNKITVSPVSEKEPLKLNLLFEETQQYNYELEVYSRGNKLEIPEGMANHSLKVRFPNYDSTVMSQRLYQLMERLQVTYLSGEEVKLMMPDAVYTLEKYKKSRGLLD